MNIFQTMRMGHYPELAADGSRVVHLGGLYIRGRDISAVSYDLAAKLCRIHLTSGESFLVSHSPTDVVKWWEVNGEENSR